MSSQQAIEIQDTEITLNRRLHLPRMKTLEEFDFAQVEPLLGIGKTDTVVREGCVVLESAMRQKIGSSQFGQKLVAEFCSRLLKTGAISGLVKPFQAELKNAFRYVRNDYMHKVRSLEFDESKALLMRIGRLYSIVTTAKL